MGDLGFEVRRKVDDVDGVKGAFLRADTATDTEALGDKGDFGGWVDFDTKLAGTDDRARLLAFLPAFLRSKLEKHDQWLGCDRGLTLGLHCLTR